MKELQAQLDAETLNFLNYILGKVFDVEVKDMFIPKKIEKSEASYHTTPIFLPLNKKERRC